jgi:hypothetical protein
VIHNDARWAGESEAHPQADAVRAFRALLEDATRTGYIYFVRRWIERGMPRRDAERRFVHLLTDLKDLEAQLRSHANGVEPRRGKADAQVDHLVRGAAVSWHKHTGQPADTSESAPFVKFCLALAALAELSLDHDRICRVLDKVV